MCLKSIKKHIGPSTMSTSETDELQRSLYKCNGAMSNFQMHLELHDDNKEGISALDYLQPAIKRLQESLKLIEQYIRSGRTEKLLRGVKFDKKLKASLKSLGDASKLFQMAIQVDQQTMMIEMKKYVETMNEGVKEVQSGQLISQQDNLYYHVMTWLGAQADSDMNSQLHERNLITREEGSCKWLLVHPTFHDWLNAEGESRQSKLWLKGPPGIGKSLLCSTAIEHISANIDCITLYQFCCFDCQYASMENTQQQQHPFASRAGVNDSPSRVKVASLLVHQLFRHFWQQDHRIAMPVSAYINTTNKTVRSVTEVARLIIRHGYEYAQEKGTSAHAEPLRLFLFLDGLDESGDAEAGAEVCQLFESLGEELPIVPKTWISSREKYSLSQSLGEWPFIGGGDITEPDVTAFLVKSVPKFSGFAEMGQEVDGKPIDDWILESLQKKAKGNFLYAKLMVNGLKYDVFTREDIMDLLALRVPDEITEIYRPIFLRYRRNQHRYTSLLFSIVAFARRPLRLRELQEAMTLALSDPTSGLDLSRAPIALERLFPPLIETLYDHAEPDNPFCRLCHSTVREFLKENPDVLGWGNASQRFSRQAHVISASRVGNLCLRYLSLERYSKLLEIRHGDCQEQVALQACDSKEHPFLSYCAKFWTKHLDDVEPTPELHRQLIGFLRSPNFQILIQAQTIFVKEQFEVFKLTVVLDEAADWYLPAMYRPVFPGWFGAHELKEPKLTEEEFCRECARMRRDYRHFINEWGYQLRRGTCASLLRQGVSCPIEHFAGEVDRCLSGLLGPAHFMNSMKEKYPSFMLIDQPFEYNESKRIVIAEGVSTSDRHYTVISLSSEESWGLRLDVWDLGSSEKPKLVSKTNIPVSDIESGSETAALSAVFTDSTDSFILGDRTVYSQGYNTPTLLEELKLERDFEPISVDLAKHDDIIVIAARNIHKSAHAQGEAKASEESDTDMSEDSNDRRSEGGSSSTSMGESSAYETYSEGSTDFETDELENELYDSEDGLDVVDNSVESSESEESESSEEGSDSNSDGSESGYAAKRNRGTLPLRPKPNESLENNLHLEGDPLKEKDTERPTYPGRPGRFRDPGDRITATLTVYRANSGQQTRIFHYTHDITAMLYQSPPVLHPHESLVVWPLGGGEVLFADYNEKSFFIRVVIPTKRATRHICMKARFSSCGGYLHIASVEGRLAKLPRSGKANPETKRSETSDNATNGMDDNSNKPEIVLSVFLTTHRLSSRKTTRSPPRLVHKAQLSLGKFTGLSLARLPFTFTWTASHLHFTVSGTSLNVFRFCLFRHSPTCSAVVTIPKLSVVLPKSASSREVYYLPPEHGNGHGVVILGSYRCGAGSQPVELCSRSVSAACRGIGGKLNDFVNYTCPAVCFYVDEDKDLGGWTALRESAQSDEEADEAVAVAETGGIWERLRSGKLTRRIEIFDWEDDIDLEGICDWCGRPFKINIA
ncbi:hypothetical protein FDECE_3100 [Fusarium decemcellulare]|nr:hypothetical protein FDECE_3100 [Fusarium decemcellulare]